MANLAALERRINEFHASKSRANVAHVVRDGYSLHFVQTGAKYAPSKTGLEFHAANEMIRAVMGPVGSGKSTMCCMDMLMQAIEMPPCHDGIRRYKGVMIRNTYPELKSTTISTFMQWFSDFGHFPSLNQSSPITYFTKFNDGQGIIEFTVLFLALDRPEDIKKLMSLEVTGGFINEARYTSETVLNALVERAGRYPQISSLRAPYQRKIVLDTNPPDTDSWWYARFEQNKNSKEIIFKQPSGLIKNEFGYAANDSAENLENLPPDYYTASATNRPESEIRVQLMGQYGSYSTGDRIFTSYNDDVHSKESLEFDRSLQVIIGFDFGLTPAAIFVQQTPRGQLKIIKEFCSSDMFLERFLDNVIVPYISKNLQGYKIIALGDPAGVNRESNGNTAIGIIKSRKIAAIPASTNVITKRLAAIDGFLTRMIDGMPGLVVSRTGCPTIRKGFNEKYQWKVIGGEKFPDKNEYSHPMDGLQYACLYASLGAHANDTEIKTKKVPSGWC